MNRTELVDALAEKTGLKKMDAQAALDALVDIVAMELSKGQEVRITGFGIFDVAQRKAREARNPRTGEAVKVPASRRPRFKAGKQLKDALQPPAPPAKGGKKKG